MPFRKVNETVNANVSRKTPHFQNPSPGFGLNSVLDGRSVDRKDFPYLKLWFDPQSMDEPVFWDSVEYIKAWLCLGLPYPTELN